MLGIDVHEIRQRCYPVPSGNIYRRSFFGCEIHRKDIDLRVRHFSPGTFRRSTDSGEPPAHISAISQIRLFPFCTVSWEFLSCKCHRCGAIQRWHLTNGVDRCDQCVADLSKAEGTEVPVELRKNLAAAVGLIHPDRDRASRSLAELPAELRDEGPSAAFDLLVRLLPVVDNTLRRHRQKITQGVSPERLTTALAAAWDLMKDWPEGFDRYAASLLATRPTRKGDGNNGATINFLRSAVTSPGIVPGSIVRIFAKYDATASGVGPCDTLTVREVAAALAISTNLVITYRRAGGLRPRFCLISKRAQPLYDKAEVELLRRAMIGRTGIGALSQRLGISIHGCEQLVAANLVTALTHPFFRLHYKELQIDGSTITSFVDQLHGGTTRPETRTGLISLSSAVTIIGGRAKPWGPIFQALLDGKIPFVLLKEQARLARRIRVHPNLLPKIAGLQFDPVAFPLLALSRCMTRKDVGEMLNLHPRDCTGFFRAMTPDGCASPKQLATDVAEGLAIRYISASELWRRTGLPLRTIKHRALHLGMDHCFAGYNREQAEAAFLPGCSRGFGAPSPSGKAT